MTDVRSTMYDVRCGKFGGLRPQEGGEARAKILGYKSTLSQIRTNLKKTIDEDSFGCLLSEWFETAGHDLKDMSEQMNFLPAFCERNARIMWFYEVDAIAAMLLFIAHCAPYAIGPLSDNARAFRAISTTAAMLDDVIWGLAHEAMSSSNDGKEEA